MSPLVRLALLGLVMALALAAFTWPSGRLEPRDLPVGVVQAAAAADAPGAAGAAAAGARSAADPFADRDAFDVHVYRSEREARQAVLDREVYGAVAGRTAYVATGASPAVAAALRQAAQGARVVDVAPGTRSDPRAATLGALALPLTLLGIVTAILAVLTARTVRERLALIAGGSVLAGLIAALLTQTWLEALPGPWLGVAGAVALGVAAVAAAVTGLAAHLGRAGIAVGAVLMMLVANPWSGIATAPHLLPEPAGTIGQLLPTGATGNLLRSVAWFDGAAAGPYLVVLGAWLVAGVALVATAGLRRRVAARPVVAAA